MLSREPSRGQFEPLRLAVNSEFAIRNPEYERQAIGLPFVNDRSRIVNPAFFFFQGSVDPVTWIQLNVDLYLLWSYDQREQRSVIRCF
jgi:hypothetical protein